MTLLIFTTRAQPCTNKFHRLSIQKVFRQSVLSPYLSPKVIPRTILRALILTFCTSSRLEVRIFIQKLFNYSAQHTRTGLFIIRANSMQHWLHTIRWLSYSRTSRSINIGEWVSVSGVWERSRIAFYARAIFYIPRCWVQHVQPDTQTKPHRSHCSLWESNDNLQYAERRSIEDEMSLLSTLSLCSISKTGLQWSASCSEL